MALRSQLAIALAVSLLVFLGALYLILSDGEPTESPEATVAEAPDETPLPSADEILPEPEIVTPYTGRDEGAGEAHGVILAVVPDHPVGCRFARAHPAC